MKQVWSGAFQRGGEADSGTDRSQSSDNPGPGSLLLFPVPVQPWCVSVLPGTLGHHVPGQLGLPYQGPTRASAGDLVPLRGSPSFV